MIKNCDICGEMFAAKRKTENVCSEKCRHERSLRRVRRRRVRLALGDGLYLYGLYDGDECYYIGKGVGRRAEAIHNPHCELRRVKAEEKGTDRTVIFADELTEEEITFGESLLIAVMNPETNILLKQAQDHNS